MKCTTKKVVLFFPIINSAQEFHWFPFSLLTLGATLKSHGYIPVIIDERINPTYKDLLLKNLNEAICFGTTAMTGYQIKGGLDASKIVKDNFPDIPVVWGGRHATIIPEQTVEDPLIDIIVAGQGELTLLELVRALENKMSLEEIPGIVYKNGKKVSTTHPRPLCDVKQLHGFAWDLIDIKRYINPDTMAVAYFSSFGCPNRCGFCANSYLEKRWMSFGVETILNDLESLIKRYRFKNLMFHDSNFFVSMKRVKAIAEGFLSRKFNVNWKASIRVDQLCKYDDSFIKLLVESGLCSLFVGVESGSQKMLDLITKDTTTEDAVKALERTKDYDIDIHASFLFGLPHETIDDLKKTIEHVEELRKINSRIRVQTCFYSPFPVTPLYEMALNLGLKPPKNLRDWQYIKEQTEFNLPPWFDERMGKEYRRLFEKAFPQSATTKFEAAKAQERM